MAEFNVFINCIGELIEKYINQIDLSTLAEIPYIKNNTEDAVDKIKLYRNVRKRFMDGALKELYLIDGDIIIER